MANEFRMPLKVMADKMIRHGASVQFSSEDLISAGLAAIWRSRHRFDPSRSSWRTWGSMKAWHAMQDELRALDHVPRVTRARARKSGEQLKKVETLDEGFKLKILDGRGTSPLLSAEASDIWRQLPKFVGQRSAEVLRLYYVRDLTLKQIGERIGLSESRVCQLHQKAVQRLQWRGKGLIA